MPALYFGSRYDTPAYDTATQVPAPIGQRCYECGEQVTERDDGWVRAREVVHRECDLLGVIGHLMGVCTCSREWRERSVRDRAREAFRRWIGHDVG